MRYVVKFNFPSLSILDDTFLCYWVGTILTSKTKRVYFNDIFFALNHNKKI